MFIFLNQQILKFFEPNERKPNKCDFPSSSKFRLWAAIVIIRPGTKKSLGTPLSKRRTFRLVFGSYLIRMLAATPTNLSGVIFSLPHFNV
jgi:hypothetical protein